MEVFPLDIQRMLLKMVSNNNKSYYYIENLRHLYRVNHMFRRWVSRYVIETLDKEWFLKRVLRYLDISKYEKELAGWNIFENLSRQWSAKSPTLLSSFVMFLHAKQNLQIKVSDSCANKLFYAKQSILKDVKKWAKQKKTKSTQKKLIEKEKGLVEKHSELVERHKTRLANASEKREAAEEVIQELDEKWSNKRIKKE